MSPLFALITVLSLGIIAVSITVRFVEPDENGSIALFIKNKLWIIGIALFVISMIPHIFGFMPNYQIGEAKFIVKDTWQGGVIFNSYDARIFYSGNADPSFINFIVSTNDDEIGLKLKEYNGQVVKLKYRTWNISPCYLSSTNEITSIELVK